MRLQGGHLSFPTASSMGSSNVLYNYYYTECTLQRNGRYGHDARCCCEMRLSYLFTGAFFSDLRHDSSLSHRRRRIDYWYQSQVRLFLRNNIMLEIYNKTETFVGHTALKQNVDLHTHKHTWAPTKLQPRGQIFG